MTEYQSLTIYEILVRINRRENGAFYLPALQRHFVSASLEFSEFESLFEKRKARLRERLTKLLEVFPPFGVQSQS